MMAPPSTTMPASGDSEDVTTGSISSYAGVGEAGSGSTLPDMRFLAALRAWSPAWPPPVWTRPNRGSCARSVGDLIALLMTVLSLTGSAAGVGVEIGADAAAAGTDPSAPVSMVRSARESIRVNRRHRSPRRRSAPRARWTARRATQRPRAARADPTRVTADGATKERGIARGASVGALGSADPVALTTGANDQPRARSTQAAPRSSRLLEPETKKSTAFTVRRDHISLVNHQTDSLF